MTNDWYRRQLGAPQALTREPMARQPLQPTRFVVDGGKVYRLEPDEQEQQVEQQPTQPWRQPAVDPPLGQIHVMDAASAWRGTRDAQRTPSGVCPGCGSKDYMPQLPNGRKGHCFSCSYREDSGDDRGGPTLQPRNTNAIRGENGQAIPVEAARSVSSRRFGNWESGRLSTADIVGRAG